MCSINALIAGTPEPQPANHSSSSAVTTSAVRYTLPLHPSTGTTDATATAHAHPITIQSTNASRQPSELALQPSHATPSHMYAASPAQGSSMGGHSAHHVGGGGSAYTPAAPPLPPLSNAAGSGEVAFSGVDELQLQLLLQQQQQRYRHSHTSPLGAVSRASGPSQPPWDAAALAAAVLGGGAVPAAASGTGHSTPVGGPAALLGVGSVPTALGGFVAAMHHQHQQQLGAGGSGWEGGGVGAAAAAGTAVEAAERAEREYAAEVAATYLVARQKHRQAALGSQVCCLACG